MRTDAPLHRREGGDAVASRFHALAGTALASSRCMRAFAGKVVVITGASSGLGRAAAVEFALRGARLVLAARRADALAETAGFAGRRAVKRSAIDLARAESAVRGAEHRIGHAAGRR